MKLDKHIGLRFLTDPTFPVELTTTMHPTYAKQAQRLLSKDDTLTTDEMNELQRMSNTWDLMAVDNQKAYWVANTVLDLLKMIKVKKQYTEGIGDHYDWSVFRNLKDQKITLLFPDNTLLRVQVNNHSMQFAELRFVYDKDSDNEGESSWCLFFVDRFTNYQCEHFQHEDVKRIEKFVYRMMCFFYLSENKEILLKPSQKHGTKKSGKIINTLPIDLTVVHSNWSITSIRTEGFAVSGHFSTRWTGKGRTEARLVYIEPFQKNGYVRKSQKSKTNVE